MPFLRARAYSFCCRTGKTAVNAKAEKNEKSGNIRKEMRTTTHTVTKDGSWWSIARDYKCSRFELARINNKTISSMLYVGDVLKVPTSK